MSRTPYSPFVENETAPLPWYCVRVLRVRSSGVDGRRAIPSDSVGISLPAPAEGRQRRPTGRRDAVPD